MQNVKFDDGYSIKTVNEESGNSQNSFVQNGDYITPKSPSIVNWLIKVGITRTEKQSTYLLIVFLILCVLASFVIFFFAGSSRERNLKQLQLQIENSI